ncbi:small proline-rich protein 2G-like [Dendropsophus ebraccatus]|uniref:small proline-rich protein 2G-like n=1 Tax=Dendropsophus ebraccatus TaxID=150705 RepID=UPI003831B460
MSGVKGQQKKCPEPCPPPQKHCQDLFLACKPACPEPKCPPPQVCKQEPVCPEQKCPPPPQVQCKPAPQCQQHHSK